MKSTSINAFGRIAVEYARQFTENGSFVLRRGESIRECARRNGAPNSPGAYIISSPNHKVVYIGKSGTMHRDGSFGDQGIQGRLAAKQEGKPRQVWFNEKMNELGFDYLEIRWFVTFDPRVKVLPAKAEADLLQAYFEDNQELPAWNAEI